MENQEPEPFEVRDENWWIARGTYTFCSDFIEKSRRIKYLNQSKVKKWKIVELIPNIPTDALPTL